MGARESRPGCRVVLGGSVSAPLPSTQFSSGSTHVVPFRNDSAGVSAARLGAAEVPDAGDGIGGRPGGEEDPEVHVVLRGRSTRRDRVVISHPLVSRRP